MERSESGTATEMTLTADYQSGRYFNSAPYATLTGPCFNSGMADLHALNNDRSRAARSDADLLGKLEYWRAMLHERGLHTEAMVMGRAASEIRILRRQVRDRMLVPCLPAAEQKKAARRSD